MDILFLRELKVETIIGIYEWERKVKQTLLIDLELGADAARAAKSDRVSDTTNYQTIAEYLTEYFKDKEFNLVETVAERIAGIVIDEFHVPWVRVKVHKPGAIRGSIDVGVIIERGS